MNKVKTLIIRFKNEIAEREVEWFRGAVIHAMQNADVLFHNHLDGEKLRFGYPLIQYKRIRRKAAIVCVGVGTEAIGQFFSSCCFDVRIGKRLVTLEVESMQANQPLVQVWQDMFDYRIRNWLPFNEENYEKYKAMEGLKDKAELLESILTGNLRSFAKGMGMDYELRQKIECTITSLGDPYLVTHYNGVEMTAFNADFKTNISLPNYIGVGKGVSIGRGTVIMKRDKKTTIEIDE